MQLCKIQSHYSFKGQFVSSYFRILRMIFKIWIHVAFRISQPDSYFKQWYLGVALNLFHVSGGPLLINLIFKTGPKEEKVLIGKENVEYESYSLLPLP